MTYKVTRTVTFGAGFDKPTFVDFVDEFTYADNKDLFPEYTETEYNSVLERIKQKSLNPFGDTTQIEGLVNYSVSLTDEGAEEWIEFETEAAYHAWADTLPEKNVEGFNIMYMETGFTKGSHKDDVIVGRRVMSTDDPTSPTGTLLPLGAYIARKWQIHKQSSVTFKFEQL